jgi:hypothetical protein
MRRSDLPRSPESDQFRKRAGRCSSCVPPSGCRWSLFCFRPTRKRAKRRRASSAFQALSAAQTAAHDVSQFCIRNPDVCDTGGAAFHVFADKVRYGTKMLYGYFSDDDGIRRTGPRDADAGRRRAGMAGCQAPTSARLAIVQAGNLPALPWRCRSGLYRLLHGKHRRSIRSSPTSSFSTTGKTATAMSSSSAGS